MLNSLLRLLDNDNLMSRLDQALKTLDEKIKNEFAAPINFESVFNMGFKDMGCYYELKVNLHEGVTEEDINVEMENDETVKISASQQLGNSSFKVGIISTLPEDAIADTLTAELVGETVVVNVEKAKATKKIDVKKK